MVWEESWVMATWDGYIRDCVRRLTSVKSLKDFNAEISRIDQQLAGTPYPLGEKKFWEEVYKAWDEDPKLVIKEAMAAASLMALLAAAEAALKQKAGQ
jgi:hypothetical protein